MLGQSSVLGVAALEIVILGFKQGVSRKSGGCPTRPGCRGSEDPDQL